MNWFSFIASDIRSLAWPAVALIILVVLKREVSILLRTLGSRLHKAKGVWGEFTFGEGVDDVEHKILKSKADVTTDVGDQKKIEQVSELARLPPPYTVSQAWLRLEKVIQGAVDERLGKDSASLEKRPLPLNKYLTLAVDYGFLSKDGASAVFELRKLRNNAAHSLDPDISTTDALRYNDIADSLIEEIERQRNNRR